MISFKNIIIVLVVLISSYIGVLKSKVYINRENEIKNFLNALLILRNKIEYTNMILKDIFKEISEYIYKDNNNVFERVYRLDGNTRKNFENEILKSEVFLDEDKSVILDFVRSLGKLDKLSQIKSIDICYNFLIKNLENAKEEKFKNVKMCKTLGIVIGLVIGIIFI